LQEYQEEVDKIKQRRDADGMDRNKLKNQINDERVHLLLYFFGTGHHTN
jgi:septin family protein